MPSALDSTLPASPPSSLDSPSPQEAHENNQLFPDLFQIPQTTHLYLPLSSPPTENRSI